MDGGPLLVNDFLSHSEKIFIGEGPESIEELNGRGGVWDGTYDDGHFSSFRTVVHRIEEWIDRRMGSEQ